MKLESLTIGKKDKETAEEFSYSISKSLPETLDEAVQVYGEAVVFNLFFRKVTQDLQNACRSQEDNESAQKVADEYTPGVARKRQPSELKQIIALMKEMKAEEVAAFLAQMKGGNDDIASV